GDLDMQLLRRNARRAQRRLEHADEVLVLELASRHIHRDAHIAQALLAPFAQLPAGRGDDPLTDRHDQPGLLRKGDEVARRDQPQRPVAPTDQRLGADDAAGQQLDLGLVVQLQFVVFE
ncbi:hypothetical protein RZS08_41645, partial [Arthrospira platensis SPKY1]|nr:hypothetical protein [Arthrospira platensis SPKY1]